MFGLPASLKISVHTGSDKFTLYPIIHRAIKKHGAGLHLKTAGTNWLEEVIGVAQSGPKGLAVAKQIYAQALARFDELVQAVRDGRRDRPRVAAAAGEVDGWTAEAFVGRCATTSRAPNTTSTCGNWFTSLSGSPPRWAPSGPRRSTPRARWPAAA